jgi:hypothetical protein
MACPMGSLKNSNDNRDAPKRHPNGVPPLGNPDSAGRDPQGDFLSDLPDRKVNQEAKKRSCQSSAQPEKDFPDSSGEPIHEEAEAKVGLFTERNRCAQESQPDKKTYHQLLRESKRVFQEVASKYVGTSNNCHDGK